MARTGTSRGGPKPLVSPQASEKPTRKNLFLYQSKLDLAKEILGAETETAALDAALDLVINGEALARGTEAMAGEEYHDVLRIASDIPGAAARS